MQSFALILLASIASVSAFSFNSRLHVPCLNRIQGMNSRSVLSMSDDDVEDAKFEPEFKPEDPKLFDMNRIVRLGRSRDQDGKSNIWSIEPKMVVEEETAENKEGPNKNVVVFGIIIAAAIAALPLFTFFSTLLPDPTDF